MGWFILIFGVTCEATKKKKKIDIACSRPDVFDLWNFAETKSHSGLIIGCREKCAPDLKFAPQQKQWNLNASLIKFIFRIVVPSKIQQNVSFSIIQFECFITGLLSWWIRSELADDMRWLLKYYSVLYMANREREREKKVSRLIRFDQMTFEFHNAALSRSISARADETIHYFHPYISLLFKCILRQTQTE